MAVTRFLRELEVRLLEDQNLAAVDLFPERHAQKNSGANHIWGETIDAPSSNVVD